MRNHNRLFSLALGAAFLLGIGSAAQAAVHYVVPGGAGNNNGSSWLNASPSIQGMINVSDSGDSVWVKTGTYVTSVRIDSNVPRSETFRLKAGVKVYAGFVGGEPDTDAGFKSRDPYTNVTILSGDLNGDDSGFTNNSENAFHVVYAAISPAETSILDGFTIMGGNSNGDDQDPNFVTDSNNGGGLFVNQANPSIVRCKFTYNFGVHGGGIYVNSTSAQFLLFKVYNCLLDTNHATVGGGLYAIGLGNLRAIPTLVNCLIINNVASGSGGAITEDSFGQAHLINCTVTKNIATGSLYDGIRHAVPADCGLNFAGETVLDDSIVYNNGVNGTFDEQVTGPVAIYHSCVQALNPVNLCQSDDGYSTSSDPVFVSSTNFRLQSTSPCIDAGGGYISNHNHDQFNVDQDADTDEATPDLDHHDRIHGCTSGGIVDMGAYEFGAVACYGDANGNGVVNVDDLLAVINGWGACPSPPTACPGDMVPTMCPSGTVDVDDLLLVINNWGACPLGNSTSAEQSMPASIQDCEDDATELYEAFTTEWHAYVNDCVEALCKAQIIDCDGY